MLDWISEGERLPPIAQKVLLLKPRQGGGWWDPCVAMILVRHEGVAPYPIRKGDRWPVDFFWAHGPGDRSHVLVTGNAFWASLESINLPPGAEHYNGAHSHAIKQADGFQYVSQRDGSDNAGDARGSGSIEAEGAQDE